MITISRLSKSFGGRDLFRAADLRVGARDRVALVGPNGSGKTTLLEMIASLQEADEGRIQVTGGAVIGYLRQETDALRGQTLLAEVLSAAGEASATEHRLAILEAEMAELPAGEERERLMAEYARLQDRFETLGGYALESEAKRILGGLGFSENDFERPTESFSGGWLMRVALAKLLLAAPDLLMLDEPTNHLDLESVVWLERFLGAYEGAILLVSHDRDFINGIVGRVVEIEGAKLISYTGDYGAFVVERARAAEQREATAKNDARKRAATQEFIDRFRYKASKAKQVQSRIKALERGDRPERPAERRRNLSLRWPPPPRAGRVVVELQEVAFGYGEELVYEGLDLAVERDHKIALVGPNGAGKTTLLKLLAGALEPLSGRRVLGHNAYLGYFAQHQVEALDPRNRVLEEMAKAVPAAADVRPRDLLGRFLFSGDDVDKPVAVLSGGERTRLALAKLLVSPLNVLCLDEPTNHLDMPSRDALEDALTEYPGALVLITHDRHLIRSVATRIVEVVNGRVREFAGDYDFYLGRAEEPHAPDWQEPVTKPVLQPSGKERRRREAAQRARTKQLRDRVAAIERQLDEVAGETTRISGILADPQAYVSGADVAGLVREYEGWKKRSRKLETSWEEASTALEALAAEEASPRGS